MNNKEYGQKRKILGLRWIIFYFLCKLPDQDTFNKLRILNWEAKGISLNSYQDLRSKYLCPLFNYESIVLFSPLYHAIRNQINYLSYNKMFLFIYKILKCPKTNIWNMKMQLPCLWAHVLASPVLESGFNDTRTILAR